eukprot:gnl/TRDRNA2_/TRDRNA2_88093_c0_seq1.p1 gnl/TRDRNA2_/TRDRNA2_88093_c0~~gnl/TRDRNA2_/TRDRNA2_88093_c0_seq1.p1  ORF type:complete len:406 (+),score=30.44 gnl/TRDRNA2_/TRDRNA2_88093_c0_seq1:37-1254(+)
MLWIACNAILIGIYSSVGLRMVKEPQKTGIQPRPQATTQTREDLMTPSNASDTSSLIDTFDLSSKGFQGILYDDGEVVAHVSANPRELIFAPNASSVPNLLDVFSLMPPPPPEPGLDTKSSLQRKRVAVCATGHFRTFVYPGVHSSLRRNLIDALQREASVDLFVVGHLANKAGAHQFQDEEEHSRYLNESFGGDERAAVTHVLKSFHTLKHTLINPTGNCTDLDEASHEKTMCGGKPPKKQPKFLQVMWLDQCIREVQKRGGYDAVIRTRPDVGIFELIESRHLLNSDKIIWMHKEGGAGADWFFYIPMPILNAFWQPIVSCYKVGRCFLPDYTYFRCGNPGMKKVETCNGPNATWRNLRRVPGFPVALVSGPKTAGCKRIINNPIMVKDCSQKTAHGYWMHDH